MSALELLLSSDPQQAHRIRRYFMATGASAMVLALLFLASELGFLAWGAFIIVFQLTVFFVVTFYVVFRAGLNLRFKDPSLTLPQILASTIVILYVLYETSDAHGIFFLIYMVSFVFGLFRLNTRQLLGLTAFVGLSYGLLVTIKWRSGIPAEDLTNFILAWSVLVAVLVFFSLMGGYFSQMRKALADSKSRLEGALEKIQFMAAHDELTGIFNRRTLTEALRVETARSDRYGVPYSVCMIDLDVFKNVNDTHGHVVGDSVLKRFAVETGRGLRPTDVFGRYGGEEFLLILPQTDLSGALAVAERVRQRAMNIQFDRPLSALRITVSIGVAEHAASEAWERIIERADDALYRAKNGGRNRVESARESLAAKTASS